MPVIVCKPHRMAEMRSIAARYVLMGLDQVNPVPPQYAHLHVLLPKHPEQRS